MEGDACMDKFEQMNNRMETAPILAIDQQSEWFSLPINDNDYWLIVLKANSKGQVPTHITYDISNVSTIDITVLNKGKLVAGPQTTMAFRNNIRETIDISDRTIGDTLVVKMHNSSGTATCYALSFQ